MSEETRSHSVMLSPGQQHTVEKQKIDGCFEKEKQKAKQPEIHAAAEI